MLCKDVCVRMCVCCSVLDIIDLFEHPVIELRQAVEKTLNDFNLSDPYWQVDV